MPKPEVIGSSRSTYTRVVLMVCEEKGIEYTLTETAIFAPELFKVHPLGKMPALRHGDVCLFESKAIATYLDRAFAGPELFPSEPIPAALTEQWVSFVNTAVDRTFIRTYLYEYIAARRGNRQPDRNVIEQVLPDMHRQIAISGHRRQDHRLSCRRPVQLCGYQPDADFAPAGTSTGRVRGVSASHKPFEVL